MSSFGIYPMAVLPDSTNFYSTVDTHLTPREVAAVFESCGWGVRRCSRTDFEAFNDVAELLIESSNPVLIHGSVADVSSTSLRIVAPLAAAGLSGSFECYDQRGALIFKHIFTANASIGGLDTRGTDLPADHRPG